MVTADNLNWLNPKKATAFKDPRLFLPKVTLGLGSNIVTPVAGVVVVEV